MKQYGVVLVFRPGTSKSDIESRLYLMRGMLDPRASVDADGKPTVHQFDPEREGVPVWYIP